MNNAFAPTHTLAITIGGHTTYTAVAVLRDDWTETDHEPGPGDQLVTREEWEAEGSASYTLDDDGCLCCNGSAYGWGNGEWSLTEITSAGLAGEAEGHEDRRHDDGEIRDEDGVEIPATPRAPRAWASESFAADYRRHYSAARSR